MKPDMQIQVDKGNGIGQVMDKGLLYTLGKRVHAFKKVKVAVRRRACSASIRSD